MTEKHSQHESLAHTQAEEEVQCPSGTTAGHLIIARSACAPQRRLLDEPQSARKQPNSAVADTRHPNTLKPTCTHMSVHMIQPTR